MAIPKLDTKTKRDDVIEEHIESFARTKADPLTAAHAPKFDKLIVTGNDALLVRLNLLIAIAEAKAKAWYLDRQLDGVSDMLINVLDKITKDKDDPFWDLFLKGKDGSAFKRPILSKQLAEMTLWPPYLTAAQHPDLVPVGDALKPLLQPAKDAEDAVDKAEKALTAFDTVGGWADYIEASNATRYAVYGDLLELPGQNPTLNLPSDFADAFYRHDTSRRGANKPKSSAEITDEMKTLKGQLDQLSDELQIAKEREAKEAKDAADRAEKQKALLEAKAKRKAAQAEEKQLEKELGKKSKGKKKKK